MRSLVLSLCVLLLVGCSNDSGNTRTNPDGGPPNQQPDKDGDGISNEDEGKDAGVDTDNDGTPDFEDTDSDDDGIPDATEAGDDDNNTPPVDSDFDGKPDFRDTDADNNGRLDGVDGTGDLDEDGIGDFADLDDDGDFIIDIDELGEDPANPVDSDEDGTPDFQDEDSDADTIRDRFEGNTDPDDDEIPSYLDLDSDGDCIPDAVEAGDDDLETPPVDTDADNKLDFLELDSDNDGIADGDEDANCNGVLDAGESSPTDSDTDDDGVSDLVETAAGTDPTDPGDNPQANGDFVFLVPYLEDPDPTEDTLDFATDIKKADVLFAMDTTGSMGGEINNLKSSVTSLIGSIRAKIPNTAFGVAGYEDFPTEPYGSASWGDEPFYLLHRMMTTNTPAGLASVQGAVDSLATKNGRDAPEAGWEMLHQVATGDGVSVGAATVPAFDPATAPPGASPPTGEEFGTIGGVGFREGALPIIIWMTDACNHNSALFPARDYAFAGAADSAQAIAELQGLSARVIAVVSDPGQCGGDERTDANQAVTQTDAIVPPEAWGDLASRPAGCAVGQCCTGQNGVGEAPVGGECPLLFRVSSSGSGLGDAVADAVEVLTSFTPLDIGATPVDDPSDLVDAVAAFVQHIEANPNADAPCVNGLTVADTNADTINDTFIDVIPGTIVCFDVVPKMNITVEPTEEPQMFKATIVVTGDGVTTLDTREIFFLVPPEIKDPGVE